MVPKENQYVHSINFFLEYLFMKFSLQGRPGEKGQKGQVGSAGIDVLQAVKVSN